MNFVDGYSDPCYGYMAFWRHVLPTFDGGAVGFEVESIVKVGACLHGDLAALARAGAIMAGPTFIATGFLKVRWTRPAGPPQEVGSTLRNFSTGAVAEPVVPLVTIQQLRGLASGPWRYLRGRQHAPRQAAR